MCSPGSLLVSYSVMLYPLAVHSTGSTPHKFLSLASWLLTRKWMVQVLSHLLFASGTSSSFSFKHIDTWKLKIELKLTQSFNTGFGSKQPEKCFLFDASKSPYTLWDKIWSTLKLSMCDVLHRDFCCIGPPPGIKVSIGRRLLILDSGSCPSSFLSYKTNIWQDLAEMKWVNAQGTIDIGWRRSRQAKKLPQTTRTDVLPIGKILYREQKFPALGDALVINKALVIETV